MTRVHQWVRLHSLADRIGARWDTRGVVGSDHVEISITLGSQRYITHSLDQAIAYLERHMVVAQ